ncbi:MAG: RHS repeat-associated core domain-containing protein [Segniliparus sp.]|uniref:TreTu family toxin n=1 Tax=Segniliparus sp. TaxID=2804064 RepID=UPI003F34CAB4
MAVHDVDPNDYASAATTMDGVGSSARSAVSALAGGLGGSSGMAGSDDPAKRFAEVYDPGAKQALDAAANLINNAGLYATLLHATGSNHATADGNSTIGGGDSALGAAPSPADFSAPSVPSCLDSSEGQPDGIVAEVWDAIKGKVGYLWPNGDEGRLNSAKSTWSSAASSVQAAGEQITSVLALINAQQAPEVSLVAQKHTDLKKDFDSFVEAAKAMGDACGEYSGYVVNTRNELIAALKSAAKEILAEAAISLVITIFSGPIGAAVGAIAGSATIMRIVNRVRSILSKLISLAEKVVGLLKGLVAKLATIMRRLAQAGKAGSRGVRGAQATVRALLKGEKKLAKEAAEEMKDAWREVKCKVTKGDPVDMATGEVLLDDLDLELPGVLPLRLGRHYQSFYTAGRLFGRSWFSSLEQRIEVDHESVMVVWDDGVLQQFPLPGKDGAPVAAPRGPQWQLRLASDGYELADPRTGVVKRFGPAPQRPACAEDGATEIPLREIEDAHGNWIRFRYDGAGVPARVEHSGGSTVLVASEEGRVVGLSLTGSTAPQSGAPAPAPVFLRGFEYDAAGNLAGINNGSEGRLAYSYDGVGRLTRWHDRNGITYDYRYDAKGRCVSQSGTNGVLEYGYAYESLPNGGFATTITNFEGASSRYEANHRSLVVAETDALGNVTRFEWDDAGRLLARTTPDGGRAEWTHTKDGDLATATRPDGSVSSYEYAAPGRVSRFVDYDGSAWSYEHDQFGELVAVVDPVGARTTVARGQSGAVTAMTDPLGNTTRVRVDAAGLPVAVVDPNGRATEWERDLFGRVAKVVAPDGAVTRLKWTTKGDPLEQVGPDGATKRWEYDGEDNLVAVVDEAGGRKRVEYREFDLVRATVEADGSRTEYDWDPELRVTKVTNPAGLVWSYEHDAAGRRVKETDFNGSVVRFEHDAMGRVARKTNASGQWVAFEYDLLGNMVAETTDAGETTRFSYDAAGRLRAADGPGARLAFERDAAGRVTAELTDGRALRFAYDAAGRRIAMITPAGVSTQYAYDAAGDLVGQQTAGRAVAVRRDELGRGVWWDFGAKLSVGRSFDRSGRLAAKNVVRDLEGAGRWDAPEVSRTWSYDRAGRLTAVGDTQWGATRFDFDQRDRIVAASGEGPQGAWREEYAYDGADNVTAFPAVDPVVAPVVAPGGLATEHRGTLLVRAGRSRYEYDADGRLVQTVVARPDRKPDVWRYDWDAYDRLREAVTPDGSVWRYSYDGLGRRVAKRQFAADGATLLSETLFAWDGQRVVETLGSGEALTFAYEDEGGFAPYGQVRSVVDEQGRVDRKFYAIVTDLVGTPRELWDPDTGLLAGQTRSTLYGQTEWNPRSTATCPLRFPGQYHDDETGLHYNYHRYYDPRTARYISPDPLGLAPAPNQHSYPHDPTMWIDPLGLKSYDVGETSRVGRWMSKEEHEAMERTGLAQESRSGTTHVANPSDVNAFARQAPSGSRYVEFDVASSALRQGGKEGWASIAGPNSLAGRLAASKGMPITSMPSVSNISWIASRL